ncbi:MAG: ATP-binding protein [Planctomycetota bacterium]
MVLRSRFFWKLCASYAVLVLATTLVIGFLVHGRLERWLVEAEEKALRDKALFAELSTERFFAGEAPADLQSEVNRVGREAGIRLTLIRDDGEVFADSREDPAALENHGARPEVLAARQHGVGVARRLSTSVHEELLYVAQLVKLGARPVGFVRVSIPLASVQARLDSMRFLVGAGTLIVIVIALALGVWVARRTTFPIIEMTQVAEAMRRGEYGERVRRWPHDEIGVLAETINQLGVEVTARIATISREQAQLRAMLAGMVEGVIAVADDDQVLFCNRAAAALLEIDEASVPGKLLWEVTRLSGLAELVQQARAKLEAAQSEMTLRKLDREIVLEVQVTPFHSTASDGLVIVLHDISNLRRLERIRRDFVANVSHELKTPLTSIKGYVETLLSGALHDQKNNVRFLKKIDDNAARLTNLVQDLLSLARIEAQQEMLPLAPVDLAPIVDVILRRHDVDLKQKGLATTVDLPSAPVIALADAEAIHQILDNLLDNALKYTPAPGQITIRLARSDTHAILEVEDSGIGIPEKDLERIFERFYRVDKARSRELGGTGLGLSIVKHLVHAMHGEVQVTSTLGKGSRFTVRLPLASVSRMDYAAQPSRQ